MQMPFFVIFSGTDWRRISLSAKLRSFLIHFCSGSRISHVCFGQGNIIIDPYLYGTNYYVMDSYFRHYPFLHSAFIFEKCKQINLAAYQQWPMETKGVLKTIMRWATAGRFGLGGDCVSVTLYAMMEAGLTPNFRITTPQHLYEWCYEHAERNIPLINNPP